MQTECEIDIRVLKNGAQVARNRDNGAMVEWSLELRGPDKALAASSERARGSAEDCSSVDLCTPTRRETRSQ